MNRAILSISALLRVITALSVCNAGQRHVESQLAPVLIDDRNALDCCLIPFGCTIGQHETGSADDCCNAEGFPECLKPFFCLLLQILFHDCTSLACCPALNFGHQS